MREVCIKIRDRCMYINCVMLCLHHIRMIVNTIELPANLQCTDITLGKCLASLVDHSILDNNSEAQKLWNAVSSMLGMRTDWSYTVQPTNAITALLSQIDDMLY